MFDRKGRACAVDRTRRGILVGYDLMPLRGLEITRRLLEEQHGMRLRKCGIFAGRSKMFACSINGRIDIDSVGWPVPSEYAGTMKNVSGASLASACGWAATKFASRISAEQRAILGRAAYNEDRARLAKPVGDYDCDWWRARDGRRQLTLEKNASQGAEMLVTLGVRLVPIVVIPVPQSNSE